MRNQFVDKVINRLAGLNQQHDAPGPFEVGDHLLDGMRADDIRPGGLAMDKLIYF